MPGAAPRKMKIDDSSGLGTHKGYPYGRRFPGRGGPMWPPSGRFLQGGAYFQDRFSAEIAGNKEEETAAMIQTLEFEWVRVDAQGEEVDRQTGTAQQFVEMLNAEVALELLAIPGGSFMMGSRAPQGYPDEMPQHRVTVEPFWMGRYPVTQEQWLAVMGKSTPCRFKGARRPVENVSWMEARKFCERLSSKTGRGYALPSEAQWEYACRAEMPGAFYCGETLTTDLANYCGEHIYLKEPPGPYRHVTTDVGSFPPNPWGVCDLYGNLWEWCADLWHENYEGVPAGDQPWQSRGDAELRVTRGGSWHDIPGACRSAARTPFKAVTGDDTVGFRVVGRF